MKTITATCLMMAGVLVALPFSVTAQQVDLLLEMQSLRQEIAELRDMVERQQYQLRKLQGMLQEQNAQNRVVGLTPPATTSVPEQPDVSNNRPATPSTVEQNANQSDSPAVASELETVDSTPEIPPRVGRSLPPVIDRSVVIDSPQAESSASQLPDTQAATDNLPDNRLPATQSPVPQPAANSQPQQGIIPLPGAANNPEIADAQPAVNPPSVVKPDLSELDYYESGFALLKQSDHQQAVATFIEQIGRYPDGNLADDAHYWIAESHYVNRDLNEAKKYFRAIIEHFPQSSRMPDARLKTAYIEQEQGNQIEARILFQEIVQYHPDSTAAISARNRLATLE